MVVMWAVSEFQGPLGVLMPHVGGSQIQSWKVCLATKAQLLIRNEVVLAGDNPVWYPETAVGQMGLIVPSRA